MPNPKWETSDENGRPSYSMGEFKVIRSGRLWRGYHQDRRLTSDEDLTKVMELCERLQKKLSEGS